MSTGKTPTSLRLSIETKRWLSRGREKMSRQLEEDSVALRGLIELASHPDSKSWTIERAMEFVGRLVGNDAALEPLKGDGSWR